MREGMLGQLHWVDFRCQAVTVKGKLVAKGFFLSHCVPFSGTKVKLFSGTGWTLFVCAMAMAEWSTSRNCNGDGSAVMNHGRRWSVAGPEIYGVRACYGSLLMYDIGLLTTLCGGFAILRRLRDATIAITTPYWVKGWQSIEVTREKLWIPHNSVTHFPLGCIVCFENLSVPLRRQG